MINNVAAAVVGSIADKPPRKPRGPDRDRNARKILWEELYHQKTDEEFVEKMRVSRNTFNIILLALRPSPRILWFLFFL